MKTVVVIILVWLFIGLIGTALLYDDVRGHWIDIALGPGTILRILVQE